MGFQPMRRGRSRGPLPATKPDLTDEEINFIEPLETLFNPGLMTPQTAFQGDAGTP